MNAAELKERLQSSGQMYAGARFWPLASPAQGLLAFVNLTMAWRYEGAAHNIWPTAASLVFVTLVISFSYLSL